MEAYCLKCRAKREMSDMRINMAANRNRTAQGVCPECGGKMVRIMGRAPSIKTEKTSVAASYEELKGKAENAGGEDGDNQIPKNGHTEGTPAKSGDGRGSRFATSLGEANVVAFVPKELRTTSILLQVAKLVTEREWGWPEMEIGDWLDTYLFHTMKQRGIILGGYQVLPQEEEIKDAS